MLPASYEKVSEETKKVVQLFMAHARGFLQGRGSSEEEARTILERCETQATWNSMRMALKNWEESRQPCSAEQLVQCFAELVWDGLTDDGQYHSLLSHLQYPPRGLLFDFNPEADVVSLDDRPFPYNFTAPVLGGPLSKEFLVAIGKTEEEILAMIKEKSPDEGVKLALQSTPVFVKTETSPPGTPNAPDVPADPLALLAQRLKAELQSPENTSILCKRKNDEPEATTCKQGRGNDGQRAPPGSRDTNRTHKQWGAPLAAKDEKLMDVSLMNDIWYSRVSKRLRRDHGPECFRVKIPKEEAWSLLGQDIARVFGFMRTDWRPIRLYTYESDRFLHVGLLVKKSQAKRKKKNVIRYKLPELFRILHRWSVQAQSSGKADGLADFLDLHRYLGA